MWFTNLAGDPSAALIVYVEPDGYAPDRIHLGMTLAADHEYRVKVEYKTSGDPVPVLVWMDYKFKPLATKTLPPTNGEWKTAELAVRRGPDPVMFSLYNTALGADHTLHVRAAELWPGAVPPRPTD